MTLRGKILGFFLLLLLAVMVLLLALVYRSTYQHTLSQVAGQLNFAHAVLSNELQSRRQAQSAMADLIAKDFTLLGAIADRSPGIVCLAQPGQLCPGQCARGADPGGHQWRTVAGRAIALE